MADADADRDRDHVAKRRLDRLDGFLVGVVANAAMAVAGDDDHMLRIKIPFRLQRPSHLGEVIVADRTDLADRHRIDGDDRHRRLAGSEHERLHVQRVVGGNDFLVRDLDFRRTRHQARGRSLGVNVLALGMNANAPNENRRDGIRERRTHGEISQKANTTNQDDRSNSVRRFPSPAIGIGRPWVSGTVEWGSIPSR